MRIGTKVAIPPEAVDLFEVKREASPEKGARDRNIFLVFKGHNYADIHVILSPDEAGDLARQVLSALES